MEWLSENLEDAVGALPDRRSGQAAGLNDLLTLGQGAESYGRRLSKAVQGGTPCGVASFPALIDEVDPAGQLGAVARKRVEGAHDLQLAGVIYACDLLVRGELPPPAGVTVTAWTETTALPTSTPGVVVHEDGSKSRTQIVAAAVGGEDAGAYALPVLIEPARNPQDAVQLALQALDLALRARMLVRHYAQHLGVGNVRIGSLPLLLGRVRAAQPHPLLGGIYGEPFALGDMPEVLDVLDGLGDCGIPFLAQCAYGPDGRIRVPDGWWLDLTPPASGDTERPGGMAGVTARLHQGIPHTLLGKKGAVASQMVESVPDVRGKAWRARGSLVTQGTCGALSFGAVGHVSSVGQRSIALTNLPRTTAGNIRLSMALEGLFGSADPRAVCRRRAAAMISRIDVPSNSVPAARRIGGIIVMAYSGTVADRVAALRH